MVGSVNRPVSLLLLSLGAACAPPHGGSGPIAAGLALSHATVVDVEGGLVLPEYTVLIRGSRQLYR